VKALDAGVSLPKAAEGYILLKRHVAVLLQNPSKKYGGFLKMGVPPNHPNLVVISGKTNGLHPKKCCNY
jgi:hypothetical protein